MRRAPKPIRLGISSCLLGERVRYDGGHKFDSFIARALGRYFEFVPLCPEVAIGLGVPRPPIRLAGDPHAPRAVGVDDPGRDVTRALAAYGARTAHRFADLSGYLLKSRSPSCGPAGVAVYGGRGRSGRGVYAQALLSARPLLPFEQEDRLGDPARRDNFLERVFAYHRWQEMQAKGTTAARLAAFHSAHRLSLMAHGKEHRRALERLAARADRRSARRAADEYLRLFMQVLGRGATRRRHADVLLHVMGYLKRRLAAADRAELLAAIEDYRGGKLPLLVPVTLLRHHHRRHPDPRISGQTYLYPDPRELALRYGM